ncbi:MAG: cytochrome c oxidase assembly protein [Anaerolineae bacterium]
MDPATSALLRSWDWRADVTIILLLLGTVYLLGWGRLRYAAYQRSSRQLPGPNRRHLAAGWRLAVYLIGLLAIAVALMSPIDVLSSQLFFIHMIQHLLLQMIVAPLLLLANPFPFLLWGLPEKARNRVMRLFKPKASFRRGLRQFTAPGVTWLLYVGGLLAWHDPNAYNAALRSQWVHDMEHLTFFLGAMLFWWHVIGAGPHLHGRFNRGARIAFLLVTVPVNMFVGVFIAFSSQPIYTYYTTVPRLGGLTVLEDQMLAGVIMWIPGSMMYLMAALVLIVGWVQAEAGKKPLPEATWATQEAMIAPGLER